MTWKGNEWGYEPTWTIDGYDVQVEYAYDDACFGGHIEATLRIPQGSLAVLNDDEEAPVSWTVKYWDEPGIRVTAVVPGSCDPDLTGLRITPEAGAPWSFDEQYGTYGHKMTVNG
jgi:hypothetical protein